MVGTSVWKREGSVIQKVFRCARKQEGFSLAEIDMQYIIIYNTDIAYKKSSQRWSKE